MWTWTTTSSRVERRKGEDLSIRDPSYRNVHFGTMVKTRLLSLSLFLVPSQIYFSSLFQRRSFCHPYFCSRHFSPFRIGSSGSGFPGKKWKEARRVVFFLSTVRINCNTLRIRLIDRERNEISRTKREKERREERERLQEVSCRFYRINNATPFFENRCRITDY